MTDRRPPLVAWTALVLVETVCQLSLRWSGEHSGPIGAEGSALVAALSSPWLWLGLGCYLAGFLLWMRILERSDLSSAFPASAVVFIATMLASYFLLGETISLRQAAGAITIAFGITLLGRDDPERPPVPAGAATDPPTGDDHDRHP